MGEQRPHRLCQSEKWMMIDWNTGANDGGTKTLVFIKLVLTISCPIILKNSLTAKTIWRFSYP